MSIPLISVHVAKAGGTSLGRILQSAYTTGFKQDYADNPANPHSQRVLDPARYFCRREPSPADGECVHGHFHPGKFDISRRTILFTMLRHPVDNIISLYFFWKMMKRQKDALHDYFLDQNLTIADTARLPLLQLLLSRTYFEGFDMNRFDLIGRHEEREAALNKLSKLIDFDLDVTIRENVTAVSAERQETEADPNLRRVLTDILHDDICFYETHIKRF